MHVSTSLAAAVFRPMKANETFGFVDVRAPAWPGARESRDVLAGPSCKITTGSGNDEQIAAKRGKFTRKIHGGVPRSHQSKPCNSQDRARQNDGLRVR
jgi:hypothetical protein